MNQHASFLTFTALLGSALVVASAACGGNVVLDNAGGAPGASSTATAPTGGITATGTTGPATTSSTTSTTTTGTSGTSSGSTCPATKPLQGPCAPGAACGAVSGSTCLAHVSQPASTTPGFRMAQLVFTKPAAFTKGVVAQALANSVQPNDMTCNLGGAATFSWLLRFDTTAGSLVTGGGKPQQNPSGPYGFVDAMVPVGSTVLHVKPATLMAPLTAGCTFDSSAGDVILPVYLDPGGQKALYLPMRSMRIQGGTMSADHGCIGRYDAEGFDPASSCQPEPTHPPFLPGAKVDGLIALEDADKVVIGALQQTLCVLLSGNPSTYGMMGPGGVTVCKRAPMTMKIVFQGDWCAATNQAAAMGCADSMDVSATFAAQAVNIQ